MPVLAILPRLGKADTVYSQDGITAYYIKQRYVETARGLHFATGKNLGTWHAIDDNLINANGHRSPVSII